MENNSDILIYQTEDGNTKIDVRLENETVWMTQKAIAELYQKGVNTINEHIKNIFKFLDEKNQSRYFIVAKMEGARKIKRSIIHYNIDVVNISQ